MESKQQTDIRRPVPPRAYRVAGLTAKNVFVFSDFPAGKRSKAESAADDSKFVASAVYSSEGRPIYGMIPEEKIEAFQRAFMISSDACSCA